MALVSFIIPYYNGAAYLPEALQSIVDHSAIDDNEIIIINDGSTDKKSLEYLDTIAVDARYTILHQQNLGPAAARNAGIKKATGEFIFFLDSDNRLTGDYVKECVNVLTNNKTVGVVYGRPVFFGENIPQRFTSMEFDPSRIVHENYIDMCCMVRRIVFNEAGLLDENKIVVGHEDWEFWLRLSDTSWKFHFLENSFFEYRVRKDSLIEQANSHENYNRLLKYLFVKYPRLYYDNYTRFKKKSRTYDYENKHPLRAFLKKIFGYKEKERSF